MAAAVAIAPQLLPTTVTLGPVDAADGWTHFELLLDIIGLTSLDATTEISTDGELTWSPVIVVTGLKPGVDTWRLVGNWPSGLPAGRVRTVLANAVAFATLGGSMTVS